MEKFYVIFNSEHHYSNGEVTIDSTTAVLIESKNYKEAEIIADKAFVKGYDKMINEQMWNIGNYSRQYKKIIKL